MQTQAIQTESDGRAIRLHRTLLVLALLLTSCALTASAQTETLLSDEDEGEPLFRVQRIELSIFGGPSAGEKYLELPPPLNELTNDTAEDLILDFSGQVPDPPVVAPKKELLGGWTLGGKASFYLSPNFGLELYGRYAKADVVFEGRRVIDEIIQPAREEIDRTSITTYAGGGNIIYHIGRERKHPIRPFVNMGFGGLIHRFPDTDDVTGLYFLYGGGFDFPIRGSFRGFLAVHSTLFTWETDEVALDPNVQIPMATVGLTWRHFVPLEDENDTASND